MKNDANQRTRRSDVDGSYWVYNYDTLGQVTSGKKYWADGTPVAGQQFEYTFDDIGNRKSTKSGGDENGANLRSASYTANGLNQYTSRGVPGFVDILGLALATNTVTVNGTAAYRKGEYFRNERSVSNNLTAVWTNIIVAAAGEISVTGNVFVAKSPEAFGYDLDGNLTNDGRSVFTWDAENRLTQIESLTNGPTASKRRVTWQYDGKGRRQRQTTYDLSSGSAVVTEDLKFVNDGWRCLAELNATNNYLVRRYTWGLDLSGSMDGAGGVGGLLWMKVDSDPQFCAYDGNGNVAGLVRGSTGDQTAAYEYDPFGRTIRMTGIFAQSNPFRFSTKRANDTTDLVLYEYRAYNPSTGRWPSRDPLGEYGGLNLYGFNVNNPQGFIDASGRTPLDVIANQIRRDLSLGEEDDAAAQAFKLYQMLAGGGQLAEPLAAELLNNWLHGAPKDPYPISSSNVKGAMLSTDASGGSSPRDQLARNLCDLRNGASSGNLANKAFTLTATAGKYYHAFGTFTISFTGSFWCSSGSRYNFKGEFKFSDRYDWHEGLKAYVGKTQIEDSWALLVEKHYGAKAFDETGRWSGTVKVDCIKGAVTTSSR